MFNPSSNYDHDTLGRILRDNGYTATERLIAFEIHRGAALATQKGRNYTPRNLAIAEKLGCCKRMVQRTTAKLVRDLLLIKVKRFIVDRLGGLPVARQISNRIVCAFTSPPLSMLQAAAEAAQRRFREEKRRDAEKAALLHDRMMRGEQAVAPERRTKILKTIVQSETYQRLMHQGLPAGKRGLS